MKNFIIIAILFWSLNLSSNELAWVNEQIESIKPSRSGLKNATVASLKDPFIFLKKNKTEELANNKTTKRRVTRTSSSKKSTYSRASVKRASKSSGTKNLSLSAIMNQSALINGRWRKIGDVVKGYTIKEVKRTSVSLAKKSEKLTLTTHSVSKKLNFKNK